MEGLKTIMMLVMAQNGGLGHQQSVMWSQFPQEGVIKDVPCKPSQGLGSK